MVVEDDSEEVEEEGNEDPREPGRPRTVSKDSRERPLHESGKPRPSRMSGARAGQNESGSYLDDDSVEYSVEGRERVASRGTKNVPKRVVIREGDQEYDGEGQPRPLGSQARRQGRSRRPRDDRPDAPQEDWSDSGEGQGDENPRHRTSSRRSKRSSRGKRVGFEGSVSSEENWSGSDEEYYESKGATGQHRRSDRRSHSRSSRIKEPTFVQQVAPDGTVIFVEHTGDIDEINQIRYVKRETSDGRVEYIEEKKAIAERAQQRHENRSKLKGQGNREGGAVGAQDSADEESEDIDWAIQKKGLIIFQGKSQVYDIQSVLRMLSEQIKMTQKDPNARPSLQTKLTEELTTLLQQMNERNAQKQVNFGSNLRPTGEENGGSNPQNQAVPSLLLQKKLSKFNKKGDQNDLDKSAIVHERVEAESRFRIGGSNNSKDQSMDARDNHQASRFTTQPNMGASQFEGDESQDNQLENTPSKYFRGRGAVFMKIKPNIILGSMTKNTTPFVPDIDNLGFCLQNHRIAAPPSPQKPKTESKPAPAETGDGLMPLPPGGQVLPVEELRAKINALTNPVVKKLHQIIYYEKLHPSEVPLAQPDGSRVMPPVFRKKMSEAAMQSDLLLSMIKSRLLEAYTATKTTFDWLAIQEKGHKYITGFVKFHGNCGRKCVHLDEFCQFLKVYLTKVVGGLPLGVPLMPLDNIQVTKISQRIKR